MAQLTPSWLLLFFVHICCVIHDRYCILTILTDKQIDDLFFQTNQLDLRSRSAPHAGLSSRHSALSVLERNTKLICIQSILSILHRTFAQISRCIAQFREHDTNTLEQQSVNIVRFQWDAMFELSVHLIDITRQ